MPRPRSRSEEALARWGGGGFLLSWKGTTIDRDTIVIVGELAGESVDGKRIELWTDPS